MSFLLPKDLLGIRNLSLRCVQRSLPVQTHSSATLIIGRKSVQFTIFPNKVLDYIFSWGIVEDQRAKAYFCFEEWECLIYSETRSDQTNILL